MTHLVSSPAGAPPLNAQRCAIGLLDSGLGGLSVLIAVRALMPHHDLIYFADTRHFPYGGRPAAEVARLAVRAARVLRRRGAGAIVVACNTASAAALPVLRERFDVPVIGIEPAVKPARLQSRNGRIAVLATETTVRAAALHDLVERHGAGSEVLLLPAPGLADRVENGDFDGPETTALLARCLAPVRESGADVLVLGCTHFAFLRRSIEGMLGPRVSVIEPSDAVARRVADRASWAAIPPSGGGSGRIQYVTSGDPARMSDALSRLRSAGFGVPEGSIEREGDACDVL